MQEEKGVRIFIGHDPSLEGASVLVVSSAVKKDAELMAARAANIPALCAGRRCWLS
ncbi:MAG: hypothetical protein R3D66_01690 [Alphaproteobacteria bacterium]